VETVPRLYPEARPKADYGRSLRVLARAARHAAGPVVKSGLMVGLGETDAEVRQALSDLLEAGVRAVTVGQYLAPSHDHHPVAEFVPPARFRRIEEVAREMGFASAVAGPFVRSSYRAAEAVAGLLATRGEQDSERPGE
jgi:lipoic acid synthetase